MMGEGKTLIFIHGAGEDSRVWVEAVRDGFAGFRSLLIDLPGHGTANQYGTALTIRDYTEFLLDLIYKEAEGRAVIVGRSLGALVALYAASLRPTSFGAIISVNFGMGVTLPEGFLERLAREPRLAIREMFLPMALPSFRRQSLDHVIEEFLMDNRRILYNDFMLLKGQRTLKLHTVRVPCLILTGLHDKITTPEAAQELRRVIKDSRLLILGDVGHFSQLEKPHLVHAVIEEFLEGLKRRGAL